MIAPMKKTFAVIVGCSLFISFSSFGAMLHKPLSSVENVQLLANKKATGKGASKGAARSAAMTKVPAGATITRTVYSGAKTFICHIYYTTK